MKITMIGTGYVGLVTGVCFSEFGFDVTCVDIDEAKIARLNAGEMPIYEAGLLSLMGKNVEAGRLTFTTDIASAVAKSDAVFIAVGTPSRASDGQADLTYVHKAAAQIAESLDGYTVIVNKSTVPVGTGRAVFDIIKKTNPEADFDVCSNPEFLREGSAVEDFMRPDRVVIGVAKKDGRAIKHMRVLYQPLRHRETPILETNIETAELTKYAGNTFLAMKVTFINEIADLCERLGANVGDVAKGIGLDDRIGRKFLQPGPGYGGSCFPKDTVALAHFAQKSGSPVHLAEAVISANKRRKFQMAHRINDMLGRDGHGKNVAILGVTFKPDTDDMRESPSLAIIPALQEMGMNIKAYDPAGMEEAAKMMDDITWCNDAYDAANNADIIVILTEWNEFRSLDLSRLKEVMKTPNMADFRNIYEPEEVSAAGFTYTSIGRPETSPYCR